MGGSPESTHSPDIPQSVKLERWLLAELVQAQWSLKEWSPAELNGARN